MAPRWQNSVDGGRQRHDGGDEARRWWRLPRRDRQGAGGKAPVRVENASGLGGRRNRRQIPGRGRAAGAALEDWDARSVAVAAVVGGVQLAAELRPIFADASGAAEVSFEQGEVCG
jgi:hypothetical protein